MPKQKKGKSRAAVLAQEDGGEESGLASIPEHGTGYEGHENYGQSGETWQNEQAAWPNYAQGDQWGHQPGSQTGAWDTGQYQQHQQQDWGPPPTSPVHPAVPTPSGSAAFAAWSRSPQGAYGAPGPPHVAHQPPPGPPPPGMPPPRPRQDPGLPAAATSWQNWGAEAIANSSKQYGPPPAQYQAGYGQQGRVTFASHDSYVPYVDRAEPTPQAQRQMFDSIMNSRGGAPAPKQPQQRPARGLAQNPTHSAKQSKKSKKEKRAQEQNPPNHWDGQQQDAGWQGNQGWEQENTQWGDEKGYGWTQQEADWGEKQDPPPAWDQWAADEAGRDDLEPEGHTDGEAWNDGRGNYQQPVSSPFFQPPAGGPPSGGSPYSRTMAYANATIQVPLQPPSRYSSKRSSNNDYINLESMESFEEALKPVESAFFGRDRKARDRIHWQFPHDKDERVLNALEWLHGRARSVATFGLSKFLQTRERGALFVNASYESPSGGGPSLCWLTYEDVVETRDRLLQESVGHYDPSMQVIVFVFLPSKSGNSLAMWRRKVPVPENIRLTNLDEIDIAKAASRKDYTVLVDEWRSPPYRGSLQSSSGAPSKKKKKKKGFFRRLFRIFKIVW